MKNTDQLKTNECNSIYFSNNSILYQSKNTDKRIKKIWKFKKLGKAVFLYYSTK